MANPNVETVNASSGKWMLGVAVLLVVAGVIGFYALAQQPSYVRWTTTSRRRSVPLTVPS
ncbi:exported hypothetical protein [Cupriavidus taiwanensis]|nr:exported hypothetical protein [Cupriavidus taiwanensis]